MDLLLVTLMHDLSKSRGNDTKLLNKQVWILLSLRIGIKKKQHIR